MPSSATATVIGHVGRDPEKRNPKGPVTFSVAVSKNKDAPTNWYRISLWGKLGEVASSYVHKGTLVAVSGRLELREYTGKDGSQKSSLELNGYDLQLLSPPEEKRAAPPAQGSLVDDTEPPF